MEGERHLLSNHADIDATINNAIEHFFVWNLFVKSQTTSSLLFFFAKLLHAKQKICQHANSRRISGRRFSPSEATTGNTSAVRRLTILLESRSPRPGRFCNSSNGLWETFIFLLFSRIMNVVKGNVGESISTIIIVAPLVAILKPSSSDLK